MPNALEKWNTVLQFYNCVMEIKWTEKTCAFFVEMVKEPSQTCDKHRSKVSWNNIFQTITLWPSWRLYTQFLLTLLILLCAGGLFFGTFLKPASVYVYMWLNEFPIDLILHFRHSCLEKNESGLNFFFGLQ